MAKPKQAAKCVAIANDVLKQIRLRKYVPIRGIYLGDRTQQKLIDSASSSKSNDGQKLLKKVISKTRPCQVCMIGAAFVSCVSLYDKFEHPGFRFNNTAMRDVLGDYFTSDELEEIEDVFEITGDREDGLSEFVEDDNDFHIYRARDGWLEVWTPTSEEAMSAICNNIVRNRGNFVKSDVERDFRAIFDKLTKKAKRIPILEDE